MTFRLNIEDYCYFFHSLIIIVPLISSKNFWAVGYFHNFIVSCFNNARCWLRNPSWSLFINWIAFFCWKRRLIKGLFYMRLRYLNPKSRFFASSINCEVYELLSTKAGHYHSQAILLIWVYQIKLISVHNFRWMSCWSNKMVGKNHQTEHL